MNDYLNPDEVVLNEGMGGEIADLISRTKGRTFSCIGASFGHFEQVGTWYGYPHQRGLPDAEGMKWWPYQKCTESTYETAWWKVEQLLKRKNDKDEENCSRARGNTKDSRGLIFKHSKDYYHLLCVEPNGSQEQIQKNYRYLVKRFHPDLIENKQDDSLEIIKSINEAYAILSDPSSRLEYDQANDGKDC